jgi:hypothetical protein
MLGSVGLADLRGLLAGLRGNLDCATARAWATVNSLQDEKAAVQTSRTLLMRLSKGHACWRWRA